MTVRLLSGIVASAALVATPVAVSAAPMSPASSLSVAPASRAGSSGDHDSDLAGGLLGSTGAIVAARPTRTIRAARRARQASSTVLTS